MRSRLWTLLALLTCVSGEYLMGGHLDNNAGSRRFGKIESSSASGRKTRLDDLDLDLMAEESAVAAVSVPAETLTGDDDDVPRYHIPYPFAFNGGKPFSLEKDPITGKIDFEKAPPVKAVNYTDHNHESGDGSSEDRGEKDAERKKNKGKDNEDVGPNEINTYANFHDFLNLPVHYSSDKYGNDKYPLISSSYANTKVQSGANSYSTYNHRPYHPENDVYARPVNKNPYAPITKTSTHKTTAIEDDKAKWTSPSTITTSLPSITTNSSRTMLSTSTRAPAVTTWKPSNTPTAFHSVDRTEMENEKNLLPIEKLHASGHAESHRNPGNVPTRTPNDGAMMVEKTQTASLLHKDHSNLDNFVLSHARPETKPAQSEEYRDSYDTYELPDGESENDGDGDGEGDGNSEENDFFLPFKDLLKEITSVSSTTASPTASTAATTTTTTTTAGTPTTTVTASSSGTTTTTTTTMVVPSRSVSSTSSAPENALANGRPQFPMMPQHPIVPSSLNSDRRQSVAESHDGIIGHGYRPSPIKLEPNRLGAGTVIESTSNIVIPPDQDTVSFVLGNRQSVEGGYYSVGTAVGENPYGSLSDVDTTLWPLHNDPHGPMKGVKHEHSPAHSPVTELPSSDRVTQKWWSPSSLKTSNEIEPTKSQSPLVAIASAVIQDTRNRSKEKDSGYVIFPDEVETKDKGGATKEEHIVIINEADGSIRELITPKTTTLTTATTMATTTTNKTRLNLSATIGGDLPQLAEDLIPPAESSRPPSYYYHYQYDIPRPDHTRLPQRSPLPPPPPPPPPASHIKPPHSGVPPPLDAGLRKRPYSPDTKLPNILPQFRPNAKASHGHRGPDAIGTMPAGQGSSGIRVRQPLPSHSSSTSRRPLLPPPPSYLQRLNPPPPPIHAVRLAFVPTSNVDGVAPSHETESTIRTRLRPPHAAASISRVGLEENKLFAHGIGQTGIKNGESRKEDHGKSEIADENEERYPEEPPMTPPRPPLFPKRRTADPPRVATLQMIQQHGEFVGENDEADEPVESVLAHEAERRKSDDHDNPAEIPEQPVYVVYPVNTAVNIHPDDSNEKDGSVVVGTRGPHRPLPPDTLLQNEPAEETHTVYNGRPLVALDFPYPLERPDPTSVFPAAGVKETPLLIPSKQRQQQQQISVESEQEKNGKDEHVDAVNVIPYLQDFPLTFNRKKSDAAISVTLHRTAPIAIASTSASTASTSTSTPIAYVYTPTHAPYSIHRLDEDVDDDDEERTDAAANVDAKQTVLLPSRQPSNSASSAPAPQNFMAPFVASISAETPNKNGWSVVVVEGAERKSDSDETKLIGSEIETQTEKNEFDADNFKPQLFGGFKPIYEFPTDDAVRRDVADTNAEVDTPRHSKKLTSVSDKG
ncbi:unnamed protein product [Lasius platythorax]|uniref:Mucin-5AC n=1 Tax=Lasius platythorax TaxID=488582 RepID=A0AAV2N743_9HYME